MEDFATSSSSQILRTQQDAARIVQTHRDPPHHLQAGGEGGPGAAAVPHDREWIGLMNPGSHAYRPVYSTTTALLELSEELYRGVDENKISAIHDTRYVGSFRLHTPWDPPRQTQTIQPGRKCTKVGLQLLKLPLPVRLDRQGGLHHAPNGEGSPPGLCPGSPSSSQFLQMR